MNANENSGPFRQSVDSLTVRRATANDAAAMLQISGDMAFRCSAKEFDRHLGELLDSPEDAVFVALYGVTIAGWIHVFFARRVGTAAFAEIGGLVTAGQRRCKGVGRALIQECETWATRNQVTRLRVRCNTRRGGAHEFYEKAGFSRSKDQVVYDKTL